MAKTVVFVVLSARAERTKDTLKGIPLRIPRKIRKSSQQPHRFFAKARRCELLLRSYQWHKVCISFWAFSASSKLALNLKAQF